MPSVGTDIVLAAKFPLPPHSSSVPNSLQRTTCFSVQEMNHRAKIPYFRCGYFRICGYLGQLHLDLQRRATGSCETSASSLRLLPNHVARGRMLSQYGQLSQVGIHEGILMDFAAGLSSGVGHLVVGAKSVARILRCPPSLTTPNPALPLTSTAASTLPVFTSTSTIHSHSTTCLRGLHKTTQLTSFLAIHTGSQMSLLITIPVLTWYLSMPP